MKIKLFTFSQNGIKVLDKLSEDGSYEIEAFVLSESADIANDDSDNKNFNIKNFDDEYFDNENIDNEKFEKKDVIKRVDKAAMKNAVRDAFLYKQALVFVSAMGIAVRYIAEYVKDKLTDSPVIVIDDAGTFVIPVLSGHVGGANLLATGLAERLGAVPVITTSSDVNAAFSVDSFASQNNLTIVNRDKIKKVSAKAIEGKPIVLSIKNYPFENADVFITDRNFEKSLTENGLVLTKKKYVVGIGLKKDKAFKTVENHFLTVLKENAIDINDVYAIASIDLKKDELALKLLSEKYRLPRIFFDAETLNSCQGDFTKSDFVLNTVGVDNVCERAALTLAGTNGKIIVRKSAGDGVTIAVAER